MALFLSMHCLCFDGKIEMIVIAVKKTRRTPGQILKSFIIT